MKRWNVIIELPAQRDIAEAHLWLAEQAPDVADRWFDSIYDTIGSLEIFSRTLSARAGKRIFQFGNP
jgi:hypothetical protein